MWGLFKSKRSKTGRTLYLAKASDDLVSHCRCPSALASSPAQMDCPWCGCGWLFTCIHCHKAFTFAKAVLVEPSLADLARLDLKGLRNGQEPNEQSVQEWVQMMTELLGDIELGGTYVYLDGCYIPTSATAVHLKGWHAEHDLPYVPQVAALQDPHVAMSVLSSQQYWQTHQHPETAQ